MRFRDPQFQSSRIVPPGDVVTSEALRAALRWIILGSMTTGLISSSDSFNFTALTDTTLRIEPIAGAYFETAIDDVGGPLKSFNTIDYPLSSLSIVDDGLYIRWIHIDSTGAITDTGVPIIDPARLTLGFIYVQRTAGVNEFIDGAAGPLNVFPAPMLADTSQYDRASHHISGQLIFAPNANLTLNSSGGYITAESINWNSLVDIHTREIASANPMGFRLVHAGLGDLPSVPTISTNIDPTQYWNGAALVTLSNPNRASVQRIFVTILGTVTVQYGEVEYSDLEAAVLDIDIAPFTNIFPPEYFVEVARVAMIRSCTNLQDSGQAVFSYKDGGVSGTGGTDNLTASNLGAGAGVFSARVVDDFQFKSLLAGANITLTPTANTISIAGPNPGEVNTASNLGTGQGVFESKSGVNLRFKSLVAGANVTITSGANTLTIASSGGGGSSGEANTASTLGGGATIVAPKSGVDLPFRSFLSSAGLSWSQEANTVTLSLDATLIALAGITTAANQLIYATGVDTFATTSFPAFGRTLVGAADAATARTTLGASSVGNSVFTGNAADGRTALGLGSIATQNSNGVTITGGSISGITDLAVADGGTGASNAAGARTNLGLGTAATRNATTSATDTTADRLWRTNDLVKTTGPDDTTNGRVWLNTNNGMFGLGGTGIPIPGDDCNAIVFGGMYRLGATTTNAWPGKLSGEVLLSLAWSSVFVAQMGFARAGKVWSRYNNNGTWTSWVEQFTTANLLNIGTTAGSARTALALGTAATADVTTSPTDATAGRVWRTNDFNPANKLDIVDVPNYAHEKYAISSNISLRIPANTDNGNSFIGFYQSNGTTRRGVVGFSTISLVIAHDTGPVKLLHAGALKLETTASGITVTGTVTATSDKKYKKKIRKASGSLARIMALKVKSFFFTLIGKDQVGFIAQDVKHIYPNSVERVKEEGRKSSLVMSKDEIIADLVAVCQEQELRIRKLEEKINDLTK